MACLRRTALLFGGALLLLAAWSGAAHAQVGSLLYNKITGATDKSWEVPAAPAQLWQIHWDGTGERQFVVDLPNGPLMPVWSQDGLVAAFASEEAAGVATMNVYVSDFTTPTPSRVTNYITGGSVPIYGIWRPHGMAFSPDKRRIAVSMIQEQISYQYVRLHVWNTNGSSLLSDVLAHETANGGNLSGGALNMQGNTMYAGDGVAWSPDGTRVVWPLEVYQGTGPTGAPQPVTALFSMSPDTVNMTMGMLTKLTTPPVYRYAGANGASVIACDHFPAFSPDGHRLAYVRTYFQVYDAHTFSVHVLNLDTNQDIEICRGAKGVYLGPVSWSPDGTKIVGSVGTQVTVTNPMIGLTMGAPAMLLATGSIFEAMADGSGVVVLGTGTRAEDGSGRSWAVGNPAGKSISLPPSAASLTPATALAGGPAFTLSVTGANFTADSTVRWRGAPLPTTFVSGTPQTAAVPPARNAAVGTAAVRVVTPPPGGGTTSALSFSVTAGPAARLAFAVQPVNTSAGSPVAPGVRVVVQDARGNTCTGSSAGITLRLAVNPTGATLAGTLTRAAVGGIATFSNLTIARTGTGYRLGAASATLTGATSTLFNVTPGTPANLAFLVQPASAAAGAIISPRVQVAVQDARGNTVTGAGTTITVALGSGPAGSSLRGTASQISVRGVATFALSVTRAGVHTLAASAAGLAGAASAPFRITPGPAARVAFVVQPVTTSAVTVITPAVKVGVRDAYGNAVSGASASITVGLSRNPTGAVLGGTLTRATVGGVATFSLYIVKSGAGYSLSASAPDLISATSSLFNITPGPATRLAFVVQPVTTRAGAAITPAVKVAAKDARGNTCAGSGVSITLRLAANPTGAMLAGTLTRPTNAGVATFSNLSIAKVGAGYRLGAASGTLPSATSSLFNVTAGAR